MEYIEVTGKTVDDAITEACQKLEVTSDRLDYEVVEKGSSGFLGFGNKPALIKARVKSDTPENVEVSEKKENTDIKKESKVSEKDSLKSSDSEKSVNNNSDVGSLKAVSWSSWKRYLRLWI